MGAFIGFVFTYLPSLVPVKMIMQNNNAVSFPHPSPSYPDHILIIPRKAARTIFHLTDRDFFEIVDMAVQIKNGDTKDFALLINGGKRQDVMQAHFHLFTGNLAAKKGLDKNKGINFSPSDLLFWEQIVNNMHGLLKQFEVPEEEFSLFVQFENGIKLSLYII